LNATNAGLINAAGTHGHAIDAGNLAHTPAVVEASGDHGPMNASSRRRKVAAQLVNLGLETHSTSRTRFPVLGIQTLSPPPMWALRQRQSAITETRREPVEPRRPRGKYKQLSFPRWGNTQLTISVGEATPLPMCCTI
jgi:hypothetical protein